MIAEVSSQAVEMLVAGGDWLAAHGVTGQSARDALVAYWVFLRWAIVVTAVLILVSSLDDLLIDVAYWVRGVFRILNVWDYPPKQKWVERIAQKRIAIMVPAWREDDVIANMVANTYRTFDYDRDRYHIFVGVYANDPDTRREVEKVRQRFPNVHRAEVPHDGPTSKADCLNWLIQNILLHEQRTGERFDVILMHDAEDVVHPYGLKTVNWFIEDASMIQMPVMSMDREWNKFVACHYMDEFAEFHTKDLPVRSALAGMTPSAGVATAFSREAMLALVAEKDGQPFNTDSLTEDYDVSHRLSAMGFKSRFIRYHARVWRKRKAWFRKGEVDYRRRELVATKEFFPDRFQTSVRQKARWMLGISIMGWAQLGWFGGLVNRYYLFRDRKALFTAPVGMFGYFIVIQVLGYLLISWIWPQVATLPPLIELPWVWTLVAINFAFLVNRMLHRAWFTLINHGPGHAILAPARIVISNVISFGAFWRASRQYISHLITRRPIAWDKTQHSYPSLSELQQGKGRLGEVLRFWNHLREEDLDQALARQKASYRPLGLLLLDQGVVADEHLAEAFAEAGETFATSFDALRLEPAALDLLGQADAARFSAVPMRRQNGSADIALAEPLSPDARAELERALGRAGVKTVRFLFAPLSDIAFAIRFAWSGEQFGDAATALSRLREAGRIDASEETRLWRQARSGYVRLGDILVRRGLIDHGRLVSALAAARDSGGRLGEVLVAKGWLSDQALAEALAAQPDAGTIEQALIRGLPGLEASGVSPDGPSTPVPTARATAGRVSPLATSSPPP